MVSLARGAASSFEMLLFVQRRAGQLTMARKIFGREAASAARNFRGEEQLCIAISFREI